jgi:ribosomal protein S26
MIERKMYLSQGNVKVDIFRNGRLSQCNMGQIYGIAKLIKKLNYLPACFCFLQIQRV